MRCLEIDWGRAIVIKRSFPARDADAPFVARLQSGEPTFGSRCDQIVSIEHREIEKLACDFHANRVQPDIFRPSATESVAIESGHWIAATTFEFASENVGGHQRKVSAGFALSIKISGRESLKR